MDKKRKRDDESDGPEDFDYAELARRAAQAAIGPCNGVSTQSTSSSDATIIDTAVVVADADK